MNLVNCLNTSHLIIPSHPLPFHPLLQAVRYLGQLFNGFSSDHPIPSSSSVSRQYVNLVNCSNTCHLIPSHPLHPSPAGMWIWLIVSLISSSHHPLYLSPGSTWTWFKLIDLRPVTCLSHPLHVFREYVKLVNWLNISHLIIPSHPLHLSPACTWTWSLVWIPLI